MTKHLIASLAALVVLAGPAAAATIAKAPTTTSQTKHHDKSKSKSNVKDTSSKAPKAK
jgi:hypothetical protein